MVYSSSPITKYFNSDMCLAYGAKVLPLVDADPVNDMLTEGRRSKVTKTKNIATWATREVRKLRNHATSW
jgi:importin subunit beta-1